MRVNDVRMTVDASSGEVLYKSQKELDFYLLNNSGYLLHNNKPFVKTFRSLSEPLAKLSGDEKAKLFDLLAYLDSKNRLTSRSRSGDPLAAKQIAVILGVSLPRTYALLKRLAAVGILRRHSDKAYYANPLYIMCSSRLSAALYQVFEKELASAVPGWVIDQFVAGGDGD